MPWVSGSNVLMKIDVDGVPTYTAFGGEIQCAYNIDQPTQSVVNKSVSGAAGADIAPGATHTFTVSGHVDDTTIDAAFDRLMTQLRAEAKVAAQYVEPAPYDTYTATCVVQSLGNDAPNDPYVKSATLLADGLPTQATTS